MKAVMGNNNLQTKNQPMSFQVYWNSCMCPLTYFVKQGDLAPMENFANTDTEVKE